MTPGQRAAKWNAENPERVKANRRLYESEHRAEITAARAVRMLDPEFKRTANDRAKAYNANNPWARTLAGARYRCESPKAVGYKWYGGKGVRCLLTIDEVKMMWFRDNAAMMKRPSIDRVDSMKDYVLDNCRFIELVENCRRAAKGRRRAA